MAGAQKKQAQETMDAQIRSFLESGKEIEMIPSGVSGNPTGKGPSNFFIEPRVHISSTNPNKTHEANAWAQTSRKISNQK